MERGLEDTTSVPDSVYLSPAIQTLVTEREEIHLRRTRESISF